MSDLTKTLNAVGMVVEKYAPEILTGIGIVAGLAGTILVGKKSMTIKEKLEPVATEIEDLKDDAEDKNEPVDKKELTKLYCKAAGIVTKEYAGAAILIAAAIVAECVACGMLEDRNAGLAAGYAALDRMFKEYRANVVEELGEEKDQDFYYGLVSEKVKKKVVDPETGKEKTVTETVKKSKKNSDEFSYIFDSSNKNWVASADLNRCRLKHLEDWANRRLRERGYLFISDIYEYINEETITPTARNFGWIDDGTEHKIDFHITSSVNNRANEAADNQDPNGEDVFIIFFDVDGYIADSFHMGARKY